MTTKRIGKFLSALGLVLLFMLWFYLKSGDRGLGPKRVFITEIGIFIFLWGVFLFFFLPNRVLNFKNYASIGLKWFLNLPVAIWIVIGFLSTYILFFVFPVFLNSKHEFSYLVNYLSLGDPIGMDNNSVLLYIERWLTSGQSPYSDGFILYPPFALILLAPILSVAYPSSYFLITFLTIFFYILSVVPVLLVLHKKNVNLIATVFVLGLFSYGFQFELERGQFNFIAYSLCFVAIYLYHFKDIYRYPAYVLFIIGTQLKIYPLVLVVMFVKDWKDWKGNMKRMAGLLLVNYLLLFVAGFDIYDDFLRSVSARQMSRELWDGNLSLNSFVQRLIFDGYKLFSENVILTLKGHQVLFELSLLIMLGLCVFLLIIQSYIYNRSGFNPFLLLACTVCALVIPSTSYDYKLPILTIPVVLMWGNLYVPEQMSRKIPFVVLVIITSVAYWSTQYPSTVKPEFLDGNFPALFVVLVASTILSFVSSWGAKEVM